MNVNGKILELYPRHTWYHAQIMQQKLIWIGLFVGSTAGGYLPALWGSGPFSMAGVIFSAVGGVFGIWLGYQLGR